MVGKKTSEDTNIDTESSVEKNEDGASSEQLWGGRFQENSDEFFFKFNESLSYDYVLFPHEIRASKAYAKGLKEIGVLSAAELQDIVTGLSKLAKKVKNNPEMISQAVRDGVEDIHSFVESNLAGLVGDVAYKLHSGRSRNDQVSTDFRMYCREAIDTVISQTQALQRSLVMSGKKNPKAVLPGYTHLQKAQPVLWAHYVLSFYEMLERDVDRLEDARRRTNIMPLGSGALSGNSWGIDRGALMKDLDFDGVSRNSMDATSDRDFVYDIHSSLSMVMIHLSRLCEDLIIYSTNEFSMVEMSDRLSTGSSLMPQKKNPDALELIRGKSGRVIGNMQGLLLAMKGLPSCYNKDLQEDKEGLFDSIQTVSNCLIVMVSVIDELSLKHKTMIESSEVGYLNATELADYFCRLGLPFRKAHHLSGQVVLYALQLKKELVDLTLDELRSLFATVSPESASVGDKLSDDYYRCISLEKTLESKKSIGGTNPSMVKGALEEAARKVGV